MPNDSAGLDWTPQGAPRSRRFDDIYFSREGGLEETRAVFLEGCGLPHAWAGRQTFTVAELGFGTGLNILALLDLWRRNRPAGGRLSIFSIEAYPLSRDDAARALSAWPELADLSAALLGAWPRHAPGFHRVDFPNLGATLDLAVGEVLPALEQWSGAADAWFLDGFSPAKNPQMWRPEVLRAVAACSAPGARLATFTVAGAVRRGLAEAGFDVAKRQGHGAKRERLEACLPGAASPSAPRSSVAVVGAGIAGAALARALKAQGLDAVIVDGQGPGAGASGNPAALVTPALDAGGGVRAQFYAQAFARAVDLYRALGSDVVIGQGVLQREHAERDGPRFDAIMRGSLFADGALERPSGGLVFNEGLWIRPNAVLSRWLEGLDVRRAQTAGLRPAGAGWSLLGEDGTEILHADQVILACGASCGALTRGVLRLTPVRGQASWARGLVLDRATAWGGYAIPMDDGVLFGATHDRGRTDLEVTPEDHARNLKTLAGALPALADAIDPADLQGRAGIRAATPDRMPLAGPVDGLAGVHVLGGLGSRGFTTAPILAEHLVAVLTNTPSPLPRLSQQAVETLRLRKK